MQVSNIQEKYLALFNSKTTAEQISKQKTHHIFDLK